MTLKVDIMLGVEARGDLRRASLVSEIYSESNAFAGRGAKGRLHGLVGLGEKKRDKYGIKTLDDSVLWARR